MNANHNIVLTLFICLGTSLFTACQEDNPLPDQELGEEIVFYNGDIYTVNSAQPWADAIYIKEGLIEYVGNAEEAKSMASSEADLIDLDGAFVMPGIHDVHLHPLEASTDNFHFILDDQVEDPEDYAYDIGAAIDENPGNDWLLGWGHWIDVPLAATRSPKAIIDDVSLTRPIAIMEQTSHSIWCNSKALELLGINADTPNPPGGIIMRESNGEANGLLIDNAGNLLLDIALAPTPARAKSTQLPRRAMLDPYLDRRIDQ